jgi:inner membrane protein
MIWWMWLVLGLFLLLLELLTPGGFYLFFFGVAATSVGLLAAAGLADNITVQWLLFGAVSLICVLFFRRPLVRRLKVGERDVDSLVGEVAVCLKDIPANTIGQVELRGSNWSARNVGTAALFSGNRCRVEHIEGLTLFVRSEDAAV